MDRRRMGIMAALGAYFLWGVLPVYWAQLTEASAYEILCHRIIWSAFFVGAGLLLAGRFSELAAVVSDLFHHGRKGFLFIAASLLCTANWCIFIWAVNNGHVIDSSVGYYINPLVNVFLGVALFGERLSKLKWLSIGIAAAGILYMVAGMGFFPWIALGLAGTFGLYGAAKKKLQLDPFCSITLETLFVTPAALAYVAFLAAEGAGHFAAGDMRLTCFLIGAGIVTAIPLILFSFGANDVPLNVLGFCQYIAPSLQLLLGVFFYSEPVTEAQKVAFAFIWTALIVFTVADMRERH